MAVLPVKEETLPEEVSSENEATNIQAVEINETALKQDLHKSQPVLSEIATADTLKTKPDTGATIERTKRVSALSLKSIQKKQQLKKELVAKQPDEKNLPKKEFTEAQLLETWAAYTKKIEKEGKYNLLSHLTMGVPKLEGTLIHLVFPNTTIKVEVERAKYDLLGYIREQLENYDIDLSIEVNEVEEKKYAYTPREKYDKLKEKNPLIDDLRKEFDLDI